MLWSGSGLCYTLRWWQLNPLASHPCVQLQDQNTLNTLKVKICSSLKARLVSENQLLYLTLIHTSTFGDIGEGSRHLSLRSVVIISNNVSSVGTEPLKHFQFPVEGHSKVLIYFTGSGHTLLFLCSSLLFGIHFGNIFKDVSPNFSLLSMLFLLFALPVLLTCWQKADNLFICVFCLCTLTVSCKAPLTACREQGMKEGFMERKRGCCCCLFSLSIPLEA